MLDASEIERELIDGDGYVILPGVISAAEAAEARELILRQQPPEPKNEVLRQARQGMQRVGQRMLSGLLGWGEVFERLVEHPVIVAAAEQMLGEDMILSAYNA